MQSEWIFWDSCGVVGVHLETSLHLCPFELVDHVLKPIQVAGICAVWCLNFDIIQEVVVVGEWSHLDGLTAGGGGNTLFNPTCDKSLRSGAGEALDICGHPLWVRWFNFKIFIFIAQAMLG